MKKQINKMSQFYAMKHPETQFLSNVPLFPDR